MLLKADNLEKSFVAKKIFENISFMINEGEKVGLLGINGVGKTTLLNIIAGEDAEYSGRYFYPNKGISIYYGRQNAEYDESKTAIQLVLNCEGLADADKDSINQARLLLKRLGLEDSDMDKTIKQLSGGMVTKVALAKAMYINADFLILDEPNNHLDMQQLEELEKFLIQYRGTILMVSHDRKLLDRTCNKIIEMGRTECKEYKGNYSAYIKQKEIELKDQIKQYENYKREKDKLTRVIAQRKEWFRAAHKAAGQNDFARANAKKQYRVVKSKQIALAKLESKKVLKPKEEAAINVKFSDSACEANIMMRIENLSKSYGNQLILDGVNAIIMNNERYCLTGPNGSGKTTLLNIICGIDKDYRGCIKRNESLKIAYYRQLHENLNLDNTILEEIKEMGLSSKDARLLLGSFLIKGEDVFKRSRELSIGERSKLSLLKVIIAGADILFLDEPTNHMDVYAKEKIEEALLEFRGAVVFVSHDRYFVDKMSTRVLALQKKSIVEYPGSFEYYMEKQDAKSTEDSYINFNRTNNKILLENRLSYLSGRLAEPNITEEIKQQLEKEYFEIYRELRKT